MTTRHPSDRHVEFVAREISTAIAPTMVRVYASNYRHARSLIRGVPNDLECNRRARQLAAENLRASGIKVDFDELHRQAIAAGLIDGASAPATADPEPTTDPEAPEAA